MLNFFHRLKIHQLSKDASLRHLTKSRLMSKTRLITKDLHRLLWEVHNYNRHFWSLILLAFVLCFVLSGCILTFTTLFADISLVNRIILGLMTIEVYFFFMLLLHTIAQINQGGKWLYREIHAFHARNFAVPRRAYFRVKFKVCLV